MSSGISAWVILPKWGDLLELKNRNARTVVMYVAGGELGPHTGIVVDPPYDGTMGIEHGDFIDLVLEDWKYAEDT